MTICRSLNSNSETGIAPACVAGDRPKQTVKPRHRRELGRWTQAAFALSERRVARLLPIQLTTLRYRSRRDPQLGLRLRLRELAANRVRFGYRRLTVLLRREGWPVNAKRIYRLYTEDGLAVRPKVRRKIARRTRVPLAKAIRPNEKWSMDFVAARLLDGRWFRVLTVVDQFTRECPLLLADRSLTGRKVALALAQVIAERGTPTSITVDNGSEFYSRAMEAWAYQYGVQLDFIRPGKPVENSYIESFNGRLRDECLNVEVFCALSDVREKLARWRDDYNQVRPHRALADATPAAFAWGWQDTRSAAVARTARPAQGLPARALQGAPVCEPEARTAFRPAPASRAGAAEKLLNQVPTSDLLEVLTWGIVKQLTDTAP
jgi:putative transposase